MDVRLAEGDAFGPLEAVATPGHAPDHLAYITADGGVALTGDAVLGEGSVLSRPIRARWPRIWRRWLGCAGAR